MTTLLPQISRSARAIAQRAFERHIGLHSLSHYTGILALQGLAHLTLAADDDALTGYCQQQFEPFINGKVSFWCNFPNYLCGGNGAALLHRK